MKIRIIEDYPGELQDHEDCLGHDLEKALRIKQLKAPATPSKHKQKAMREIQKRSETEYQRLMKLMVNDIEKIMIGVK